MESFRDLFLGSGIYGTLSLFVGIIAAGILIALTIIIKNYKKYLFGILLVLAPLIVGIVGTFVNNNAVNNILEENAGRISDYGINNLRSGIFTPLLLNIQFIVPPMLILFISSYIYKLKKAKRGA